MKSYIKEEEKKKDDTGEELVTVIEAYPIKPERNEFPHNSLNLHAVFGDLLQSVSRISRGKLIPQLGVSEWDGHIFVSGATGSGKTWLIKDIILEDKKNRPVYLFTDIPGKDPSYKELYKGKKMKKVSWEPKGKQEIHPDKTKNKDVICIFDDTRNETFLLLRDKLLERGRHNNIVVISVAQKMRDRAFTKVPQTNSRWRITFPKFDRMEVFKHLMETGLNRKQANALLTYSDNDGRYLMIHQFAPRFIITEKSFIRGIM